MFVEKKSVVRDVDSFAKLKIEEAQVWETEGRPRVSLAEPINFSIVGEMIDVALWLVPYGVKSVALSASAVPVSTILAQVGAVWTA